MSRLSDELIKLYNSDEYPLHMPGHKRQDTGSVLDAAYHLDITEIEGYDNLYDAHGILRDAMDYAGSIYNCPHTYYLVNGSTTGIHIAIHTVAGMYASAGTRDRILTAANSHRSVHAAVELSGLDTDVIEPDIMDGFGIYGGVSPAVLEQRLSEAAGTGRPYAAVIITSPNYEGIISDIEVMADICHRYDTVLIVDEAHGAHLDLSDAYPGGALKYGADIVIHSTHKTLAAMTQTALLHVQGNLVDITTLEKYWTMLQTSSPSYVLMASIDNALHHITEHPEMVSRHMEKVSGVRSMLMPGLEGQGLKSLKLLTERDISGCDSCVALDPCKIVISTKNTYIDGYMFQKILLDEYHIRLEMAADDYIVGITTYMDTGEGLERFTAALLETDDRLGDRYYNNDWTPKIDRHADRFELYAPCIPKSK